MTRSPTLKRFTLAPTSTTSPAPSESGTRPGGIDIGYMPLRIIMSRKLSELARTRTSTSPAPGDGMSRSARTRPPRLPSLSSWYARIFEPAEVMAEIPCSKFRGLPGEYIGYRLLFDDPLYSEQIVLASTPYTYLLVCCSLSGA